MSTEKKDQRVIIEGAFLRQRAGKSVAFAATPPAPKPAPAPAAKPAPAAAKSAPASYVFTAEAAPEVSEQLGGGGLGGRDDAQAQLGRDLGAAHRDNYVHAFDPGDLLD